MTDAGWVTERLQVGGMAVHCRRSTRGTGTPLVHVHGFAISGSYLMPTARALAGSRVNIVPDLPGGTRGWSPVALPDYVRFGPARRRAPGRPVGSGLTEPTPPARSLTPPG